MKHANVALFIPFNGCPHRCSFCDQRSITGEAVQPTPDDVRQTLETALYSLKENSTTAEIAFFGGSFTAIDRSYMISLLDATVPYIDRFAGIRISTRPDAIDPEVLALLRRYHVTSIELGAQSMSDDVLLLNDRGHTAADVCRASSLIREHGFSLGLQMMTGLYGSSDALDLATAEAFTRLRPDTVRIYPTIVMRRTRLGDLFTAGKYVPQTLDGAVDLCARLISRFENEGIRVIRVGLHDTPSLRADMLAGPYHPAFRELCESRMMLSHLLGMIHDIPQGTLTVAVSPRCVSKMIGNQKANRDYLRSLGYELKTIGDSSVPDGEIVLV